MPREIKQGVNIRLSMDVFQKCNQLFIRNFPFVSNDFQCVIMWNKLLKFY